MDRRKIIRQTEKFVAVKFKGYNADVHGIRHVERVRKWAMKIGKMEGGVDMFLLELAVLLHDVGRPDERKGRPHHVIGERISRKYLQGLKVLTKDEIDQICEAVLKHGKGGESRLIKILQDADRMDLWGATAIARVFQFYHDKTFYVSEKSFRPKKYSFEGASKVYADEPWGIDIVSRLNFHLNMLDWANTRSARKLAKDKIRVLKKFISDLKKETIDLK